MDDASLNADNAARDGARALSQAELDALTDLLVEKLKTVFDPEIPVDIYELGLIYKVDVSDDGQVTAAVSIPLSSDWFRRSTSPSVYSINVAPGGSVAVAWPRCQLAGSMPSGRDLAWSSSW